jgi:hypothetical protein
MPDYEYEYEYEHDLDRTQREFESALQELQPEHFEIPGEEEYFGETETANAPQEADSSRASSQHPSQEAEELELELAAELLEVTSEEELERFLGDVFKKVGGFVSGALKSPVFKALGGVLKPIAKAALPIAGGALGTLVGGPAGGMIGSKLATTAGNLFGLELEGMSPGDREFEVARRFVRLASGAAEEVGRMPYRQRQNPYYLAKLAAIRSGRRYFRPRRMPAVGSRPGVRWSYPRWSWATRRRGGVRRPSPPFPPWSGALLVPPPPPQIAPPDDNAPEPIPEPVSDDAANSPPEDAGDSVSELEPAIGSRRGTWFRRGRRIILIGV